MASTQPGVWGIDVGQCGVKALRLAMVDDQLTASAFDYIEYPKILTQPDADPDQLIREALEQFLSRNDIRGDMVVISVPGQSGLARFVKLPPVEEKKIADIVRFEAKQQIPFPLEEVVWDFQKLGTGEVSDGFAMGTEIGLFALKRDMVFRYLQHFKDVAVEVHIVQMAPLALCNFVAFDLIAADKPKEEGQEEEASDRKKCVVALDIGTDNSNLVITDGDRIIWQRPIPLGGNHFTRAMTKDLKLTFAKAEHLKRNAVKSPDLRKILAALKTVLNDFVGEVQRSLGYFTNTHRDAQIDYMIGLGNAFRLPGLQKFLQEKLQLDVRKFTKMERTQGEEVTSAPPFAENLPTFAVAYGLALQGMGKTRLTTNLLPYEVHVERLVRSKKPWAVAAAAVLVLAVGGLSLARSVEKAELTSKELKDAQEKVKAVEKQKRDLDDAFKAQEAELKKVEAELRRLAAGVDDRWNWQQLHQYINLALPAPDGSNLPERTRDLVNSREKYATKEAKLALKYLEDKRFPKPGEVQDPLDVKSKDVFIKHHLIQVNIEAISTVFTEDLKPFLRNLTTKDKKDGAAMDVDDERNVKTFVDSGDPKTLFGDNPGKAVAGWVVEIRGYTYHKDGYQFVKDTFVENLQIQVYDESRYDPKDKKEFDPPTFARLTAKEKEKMKDRVCGRVRVICCYSAVEVKNPDAGRFTLINSSTLDQLVTVDAAAAAPPTAPGAPPAAAPPPAPGAAPPPAPGAAPAATAPPAAATAKDRKGWKTAGTTQLSGAAGAGQAVGPNPRFQPPPQQPPMGQPAVKEAKDAKDNPPRTEFVLLFVWRERYLGADDIPAAPVVGQPPPPPAAGAVPPPGNAPPPPKK